ncbi:TPA: DUF4435 domain-containing protein [Serratia liquefaciens]|nr:DUF4435 domain-containing protein [Serratia liquefaciens]
MSGCTYTIDSYITSLTMSSKKRILVEGRHDRLHLYQLIYKFNPHSKVMIDTAQDIKASDRSMAKNNRLKIEAIHSRVKNNKNVWFLCDREFREFDVNGKIDDLLNSHFCDNSLYWTLGHSLENYFFNVDIIADAFQYLSPSEYKFKAIELFKEVIYSSFELLAVVSLSAKEIDKAGLPCALIDWRDLVIFDSKVTLKRREKYEEIDEYCVNEFFKAFEIFMPIVISSDNSVYPKIIRGHTGVLLLQKVFSACLNITGSEDNKALAEGSANYFANISEISLTTALAESWIRKIGIEGDISYPEPLIKSLD